MELPPVEAFKTLLVQSVALLVTVGPVIPWTTGPAFCRLMPGSLCVLALPAFRLFLEPLKRSLLIFLSTGEQRIHSSNGAAGAEGYQVSIASSTPAVFTSGFSSTGQCLLPALSR